MLSHKSPPFQLHNRPSFMLQGRLRAELMFTLKALASVQMLQKTLLLSALTHAIYSLVEPNKTVLHVKPPELTILTTDGACLLALKSKVTKKSPALSTNVGSATLREKLRLLKKFIQELLLVIRKSPFGADTESLILEIKDPMVLDKLSVSKLMTKLVPLWMLSKKTPSTQTIEIISGARFSRIKRLDNMVLQNRSNPVWQDMISEVYKPAI
jgi:hypothetical protein